MLKGRWDQRVGGRGEGDQTLKNSLTGLGMYIKMFC